MNKSKIFTRPLSSLIKKLSPSMKEGVAKKLFTLSSLLKNDLDLERIPTIEEAFQIVGKCEIRIRYIEELVAIFSDACNLHYIRVKITELQELKENCIAQRELATKIVRAHLLEMTKDFKLNKKETA